MQLSALVQHRNVSVCSWDTDWQAECTDAVSSPYIYCRRMIMALLIEDRHRCARSWVVGGSNGFVLLDERMTVDYFIQRCRVTAELLMTSNIGKRMRALGKGSNSEIARLAKEVVGAWKEQLLGD